LDGIAALTPSPPVAPKCRLLLARELPDRSQFSPMKFKKPHHCRTKLFVNQSFSSSLSYDPPSAGLGCGPARAARVKTALKVVAE